MENDDLTLGLIILDLDSIANMAIDKLEYVATIMGAEEEYDQQIGQHKEEAFEEMKDMVEKISSEQMEETIAGVLVSQLFALKYGGR